MPQTAIIIGQRELCRRLERQLECLPDRPTIIGVILADAGSADGPAEPQPIPAGHRSSEAQRPAANHSTPVLGTLDDLESIVRSHGPGIALLTLPAAMKDLITSTRTRLRKLGVADRFIPTMEDLVAGVGPRTQLDIDLSNLLNRPPRQIDERSVRTVIQGKRVLITGAGGSIGGELARIVARYDPAALLLVERSENALFEIDRQIARSHPRLSRKALLHDVVDERGTFARFEALRPQVIFHAAAHKHVPMMEDHPAAAIENNVFGTKSVADAADAVAAERFVMISTDKAVNPTSVMGATKRLAELYVQYINQRSATAFSIVRFGNVLGSSGSVLETWSRQIADGGPITVTDPRMTRYFMTIPEAAALVIQSAALVAKGQQRDPQRPRRAASEAGELDFDATDFGVAGGAEVFLLDMGEPIRILDLACRYAELHGLTVSLPLGMDTVDRPSPGGCASIGIELTGIRPGEKLHEKLSVDGEMMRPTAHRDIHAWLLPPPERAQINHIIKRLELIGRSRAPGRKRSQAGREPHPDGLAGEILRLVPELGAAAAA